MIETSRLILRPWREEDGPEFIRLTNTPAVMAHLGGVQVDAAGIEATIARQQRYQAELGHCMWLINRRSDNALLGFCGLQPGSIGTIDGEIEIGWRLREDAWGQGYAKEAARASLDWGWANLDTRRIVAITVPANTSSWGLMIRLGMERRPDMDFGHPLFAAEHPLHRHIAYVLERPGNR